MNQSVVGTKVMGEIGSYVVNGLKFRVKVMDVKKSSGKISLLVTPCDGKGVTWVDARKVILGVGDPDGSYLTFMG
jgi:hypothetical protein